MNNYTCGITMTGDSAQHAKDRVSSIGNIFSVVTGENNELVCTSQDNWEPSFVLLFAFVALCIGISLGLTAKRSSK